MNAPIDMKRLLPAWERFRAATDIAPIRDEAHYVWMTEVLESLLEAAAGDPAHPAMELADIVGDLPEIGSQGVVSEILAGKRELNIRQVRALSERFGVSAATFL
ncbi:helix-turn-helix domain-containing protein [Castellaniella sp. WN]